MKYLYILKVGTTFPLTREKLNDFDSWIARFIQNSHIKIKVIDILKGGRLPNIKNAKGFIISGSHCMVTDELPWSVKLEKYIDNISKTSVPLLGICYGHQLIAKAFGGISDFNVKGEEIGVVKIHKIFNQAHDPLLKKFPNNFSAYETHYQSVVKLPIGAKILAKNKHDNHQAIRYKKNIWGIQFHPEFDQGIMKEYIFHQKETLLQNKVDIDKLLLDVKKCDKSSAILMNFAKIVQKS
jgi:GMP synthase (glutamine-hydrolysing)